MDAMPHPRESWSPVEMAMAMACSRRRIHSSSSTCPMLHCQCSPTTKWVAASARWSHRGWECAWSPNVQRV